MINHITFRHKLDPSIRATFGPPSREAYAAFWGALCNAGGIFDHVDHDALLNLCIACRTEPDAAEFRTLIDECWSGLPNTAGWALYAMAGHFVTERGGVPMDVDAQRGTGAIVDLSCMNDGDDAEKRTKEHLAAFKVLAGDDAYAALVRPARPWMSRALVAMPWGGYYLGRMPSSGDRMTASRIRRAPASEAEAGPYAAAVRLALDCAIWPDATALSALFDKRPGAATKLGAIVNDIGGGAEAVEAK